MTGDPDLYLISCSIDRLRLISFATARGTIPRSGDPGYAIHQVMTETFGPAAPKPFHFYDDSLCKLLAYSPYSADELKRVALAQRPQVPSWELASAALGLPAMEAIPLPCPWVSGKRYRFAVRVRPVSRTSHAKERGLPREGDVFLQAVASKPKDSKAWLDRQEVYLSWFRNQVPTAAATLISLRISSMARTLVYRKGAPSLEGPDVQLGGTLEVGDPAFFNELLRRGIGRHRAFGFGMVLLGNANS